MDGGGTTTNTTSTNSAPWAGAQPYLSDLMSQAKGLYDTGSQYAPFSTVAPFSPATQAGLNMTAGRAMNGSPVVQAADNSLTNLLQANTPPPGQGTLSSIMQGYSDPGQATQQQWANPDNINPYLTGMFNAASKPVIDAVNAQFSQAGRTGSTANQDALTTRLGDLAANIYGNGYENAANRSLSASNSLSSNANAQAGLRTTAAGTANAGYNTGVGQQIAGAALAPQLAGQDYTDLQNLLSVGGQYDNQAQNYINDALQRWNFSQNQPWNLLNNYRGVVSGLGNLGGTSTGTATGTVPGQSVVPSLVGAGINLLSAPTSQSGQTGSIFANLLGL